MQAKNDPGAIPVRYVKGIGPKRSVNFADLGIENVRDLFYYLPRRYEDRSDIVSIKDLKPGQERAVIGKVAGSSVFTARTGTGIF